MSTKPRAYHVLATAAVAALAWLAAEAVVFAEPLPSPAASANATLSVVALRLSPETGEHERWEAVSGTYVVAPDGAIAMPLAGAIPVAGLGPAEIADRVAERLRTAVGLVDAPAIAIEITAHPPVYVIGDVAAPGAHAYVPGLTAIQALALSGGRLRLEIADGDGDIGLYRDLKVTRSELARAVALVARLEAEAAGSPAIAPPERPTGVGESEFEEILDQEERIRAARARSIERQLETISDLSALLAVEIDALERRAEIGSRELELAERRRDDVAGLVERGSATVQRLVEAERDVTRLQTERLDYETASMRARQAASQTERQDAQLREGFIAEVAIALQDARARLSLLNVRADTLERTALLAGMPLTTTIARERGAPREAPLQLTVLRTSPNGDFEFEATESTRLLPGDVLKVDAAPVSEEEASAAGARTTLGAAAVAVQVR